MNGLQSAPAKNKAWLYNLWISVFSMPPWLSIATGAEFRETTEKRQEPLPTLTNFL